MTWRNSMEQVRRLRQRIARLPLSVQFGAGNEHQREHGEILRVHRADERPVSSAC